MSEKGEDKQDISGGVDVSEYLKEGKETTAATANDKVEAKSDGSESNNKGGSGSEKGEAKKEKFRYKPKTESQERDERNIAVRIYDRHYRKLLVIPTAVVIISALVLLINFSQTGEFFEKDVSIKGGATITVLKPGFSDFEGLESSLAKELGTSVNVRSLSEAGTSKGVVVEAGITEEAEVAKLEELIMEKTGAGSNEMAVQIVGSSLGASFFKSVIIALAIAFAFMAAVVFIYLRIVAGQWVLLPSLFIIWTAFIDMVCTFAVISLLKVELSTAGLAAFLLLIGYSVDTDILLTLRVLKGKEARIFDRVLGATKTGIFLTLTAMAAVIAGFVFTQSDTIKQMMLIMAIGLSFDLLHTWITNAGVLRWFMERKTYG